MSDNKNNFQDDLVAGMLQLAFLGAPRGAAAFGQMNMPGASVQEQCLVGFQVLRKACGNVVAGQAAPPMKRRATDIYPAQAPLNFAILTG